MYNPPDKYQKEDSTPTSLWAEFHDECVWVLELRKKSESKDSWPRYTGSRYFISRRDAILAARERHMSLREMVLENPVYWATRILYKGVSRQ